MADRIERQEERVRRLESSYRQTSSELQTNEEVQRAQAQEIAQLDRNLTDPNLPPEERSELEATRVAAAAEDSSQRVALTRKITDIGEALLRERNRLNSLRAAEKSLASTRTPVTN
jgi:hypothetical protein